MCNIFLPHQSGCLIHSIDLIRIIFHFSFCCCCKLQKLLSGYKFGPKSSLPSQNELKNKDLANDDIKACKS